jgi:hypothetical protein
LFIVGAIYLSSGALMKKQPRQDRDVQGDGKASQPFENNEFGLNLDKAAFDPGKRRHGNCLPS